ncbi:hypothetical protein [Persicimonas caeni]|nr:hypothetical protein [Persicimonas caeni]
MQPHPITQLIAGLCLAMTLCAASEAVAQDDGSRLEGSVRVGMEYDDNPLRLQTNDPRLESDDPRLAFLHDDPDMLARYFTTLDSTHRVGGRGQASLRVRHGGKFYRRTTEADAMLTQVLVAYRYRLAERLSLVFDADVKDRTERLSRLDYNRGGVRLGLGWAPEKWRLSARAGWRYFAYKPVAALSSQGPQFDALVRRYFTDTLAGQASYSLTERQFDDGRQDTFHVGRLGLVYRSDIFVDASYVLSINRSPLDSQDLTRHGMEVTLTAPLFEKFYGSSKLQLQRTAVAEESGPDALFFVDEENRNVVVMSLARPIGEQWEVEGRWSMYIEEFDDAQPTGGVQLDYSRQTFLLAVGWGFE